MNYGVNTVCVYSLLTQGMVFDGICTNHMRTCMDSCTAHLDLQGGQAGQAYHNVYLHILVGTVEHVFLLQCFCSRDSLSSSHRFDRTKLEPVSIFKTNPMSLCRPGLYSPPALHVSVLQNSMQTRQVRDPVQA